MDLHTIKNRFGIIGNAPSLNYALKVAEQVASTDLSVLIQGESGVGKEVFSQIIHALSSRKHAPFIAINCGAIPEGTIDSELFGHEKGSFTSALDQRKGYFETANGGTIFLDEIGEMPIGTQARLLRVLETGEFIRVGSSKVLKTEVRVVAATNRELLTSIRDKKFREDLYYRLNTVPIHIAPLRERKQDIILLFNKFLQDFSEKYKTESIVLNEDAQNLLMNYSWPGNIRELKNIAEQISVLTERKKISGSDLEKLVNFHNRNLLPVLQSSQLSGGGETGQNTERDILYKLFFDLKNDFNDLKKMFLELVSIYGMNGSELNSNRSAKEFKDQFLNENLELGNTLSHDSSSVIVHSSSSDFTKSIEVEESLNLFEMEKELILKALHKHHGKRKIAANELGISERTLYRKIKEYNIDE